MEDGHLGPTRGMVPHISLDGAAQASDIINGHSARENWREVLPKTASG